MRGACLSLISLNLIDRMEGAACSPLRLAKVFKIYGIFDDDFTPDPQFFRDFLDMLQTYLSLEATRLNLGIYHTAAWPSHGRDHSQFCYFFTFGGPEFDGPDRDSHILCNNFARRLASWIRQELQLSYPRVRGVWCQPLVNCLDESTRFA